MTRSESTDAESHEQVAPEAAALVDKMAEQSFPASDPPAVWTWDVPEKPDPSRAW